MRSLVGVFLMLFSIINGITIDVKDFDGNIIWSGLMFRDMTYVFHLKEILVNIVKIPASHQRIYLMDKTLIEDTFDLRGLRNDDNKIEVMIKTWLNYFREYQPIFYGCILDRKKISRKSFDMVKLSHKQTVNIKSFMKFELKLPQNVNIYFMHQNKMTGYINVYDDLNWVNSYNDDFDPNNGDLLYFVIIKGNIDEYISLDTFINKELRLLIELLSVESTYLTIDSKYINMKYGSDEWTLQFSNLVWPKMYTLKEKIKSITGIPMKLQYLRNTNDNDYLREYYTQEIILIERQYFGGYQRTIKGYGIKSSNRLVNIPSDVNTVNDVKQLIRVHYGLNDDYYVYLFHLKKDKKISIVNEINYFKLYREMFDPDNGDKLLYLVRRQPISETKDSDVSGIIVDVKDADNNILWSDIIFDDNTRVLRLKEMLVDIVKAPTSHQRIYGMDGVLIGNEYDLKKLSNECHVSVIIKTWIIVKHNSNNIEIEFDVNLPATLDHLRLQLKTKTGIPLKMQQITNVHGLPLQDNEYLENIYKDVLILDSDKTDYFEAYQPILYGINFSDTEKPSQSVIIMNEFPKDQHKTIQNIIKFIKDKLNLPPNLLNVYLFHQNKKTGKIYVVNNIDFMRLFNEGFDPDNGDVLYYVISKKKYKKNYVNNELQYVVEILDRRFTTVNSKDIGIDFSQPKWPTMDDLKDKIKNKYNIPFKLKYGIYIDSQVKIVLDMLGNNIITSNSKFIFIHSIGMNKVYVLEFRDAIWPTIYDLKIKIKETTGIPLKLQWLIDTNDDDYLKYYYTKKITLIQKDNYFEMYQQKIEGYGVKPSNKIVTIPSNAKTVADVKQVIRDHHDLSDNYYVNLFHQNNGNTISIVNELDFITLKKQMFDPDNNDKLYYLVSTELITNDDDPFIEYINQSLKK